MPHTRHPPETPSEILATATHNPAWTAILSEQPVPTGSDWGDDTSMLKDLSEGMYPHLRAGLDASRPSDVEEKDVYIDIPSTALKPQAGRIRVLVCQPATLENEHSDTKTSPIIILFHGGGNTVGNPESELPLARILVQQFHAVVVMPAYRLAPEHTFPSSFNDGFEVLKIVASEIRMLQDRSMDSTSTVQSPTILPSTTNPSSHLIIGGTSAGATIATSLNHLYHNFRTTHPNPPITGLLLSCGSCINPDTTTLPSRYKPFYLSRTQNVGEAPLDEHLVALFFDAVKPDFADPVWSSFDQRGGTAGLRESVGEDHVWMAGNMKPETNRNTTTNPPNSPHQPPQKVYFQVCGADISRDDSLIYERVLREECGVGTRMDLYMGFGHVFWGMSGGYGKMEMSGRRMEDSVEGVGWLVG